MKDDTSLEARIHSVRRAIRSRQPLRQRIDLVRAKHRALTKKTAKTAEPRRIEIRLDGSR